MDQNITTRLVNNSAGLKKHGAYHLDMFWLSLITGLTSICGLPWISPPPCTPSRHAKSLTDTQKDAATGREVVTGVTETRWTPLILNALIGLSIVCLKPVLVQIPMCVLSASSSTSASPLCAGTSSSTRVHVLPHHGPRRDAQDPPSRDGRR